MIHEVILSLLHPTPQLMEWTKLRNSDACNDYLNPCELVQLENICTIAYQYGDIKKFVTNCLMQSTGKASTGFTRSKLVPEIDEVHNNHQHFSAESGLEDDSQILTVKPLYLQSLADGINQVLQPYHDSIVELEKRYLKKTQFSLLFVFQQVDVFQPLFTFLLSLISAVESQKLQGGAILQYLQDNQLHGNEKVFEATKIMQSYVYGVFFKQLTQWLLYGKCNDTHGEFFIQQMENATLNNSQKLASTGTHTTAASDTASMTSEMWRYEICYDLLPRYFSTSWAEKVLFIGQTVVMFNSEPEQNKNIDTWELDDRRGGTAIRKSLWNGNEQKFVQEFYQLQSEPLLNVAKLEQLVNKIKNYVAEHLFEIAIKQADLVKQLRLIKDFYLLGRGELFMEFLKQVRKFSSSNSGDNIGRDINKIFRVAANCLKVTEDLDQFSFYAPKDEELSYYETKSFFDLLTLQFKVKWPLHLLFSPGVLERYNDMFRFLLRIKKIQYDLHIVWHHQRDKKMKKQSQMLQFTNKLNFVINNLQYYLHVDVLESQFCILMNSVQTCKDFDEIQKAHILFQVNILSLCFLMSNCDLTKSGVGQQLFDNPVHNILNKMLELVDRFCELSLSCNEPMLEPEKQDYLACEELFMEYMESLMKMLTGLKASPSSAPLSQLLLRLDYNYWFSTQNSHQVLE